MAENEKKDKLEQKLGQLTFKIGKKDAQARVLLTQIKNLQAESNDVATEIEKLDG